MSLPILPLIDTFGRRHNNLRLSVTDRCNIRCFYCMPAEQVKFLPRHEILTFEEIERLVQAFAHVGVDKLRLTGGEPLVRSDIDQLVHRLKSIPQIREVAMTTNAVNLAKQAERLKHAGLDRLNISLDALDRDTLVAITRRDVLDQVLAGIAAAQDVGFKRIRLNAVAIKGLTEAEVLPLARFALERDLELRFIEYMPLDSDQTWSNEKVLSGETIRELIEQEFGPLVPAQRTDPSQPAFDYRYAEGRGRLGLIHPVTAPFCDTCNRLRLTAEGKLRNCLFSLEEWDLRALLRQGASEQEILALVRACVLAKQPGHLIGQKHFERPVRTMHQIGG
ncbi:MAG: GTP 3',8-cyclase MoaA [Pirellulaceae bacterium]|nr:GTP 3',8-cyclase MoaA [Pirellulaceae bacterium]